MTRIAVIETGRPPAPLDQSFGDYPAMFAALLGEGLDLETFDAGGVLPDPVAFDGAIVTGSPSGVYDDDPWIERLLAWLRTARGRTRLAGICFGHQAMAQAFGGQVEKSARGWGVGLQAYVTEGVALPAVIRIPASHQDQVVVAPPGAALIARSAFCPFAGFAYGTDAVSLQAHPEFTPAYAAALLSGRRGRIADALVDAGVASLDEPNDRGAVGDWLRVFLTT